MTLQRRLQLVECTTEDNWVATAIKVAFATSDMAHVDQHFGAAQSFAIYALDRDRYCVLEVAEFGSPDEAPQQNATGQYATGQYEDKLAAKIDLLEQCAAVYSQAIGASAINQLRAKGIQPIKVSPGTPISELITALQQELQRGPSSWLARAIEQTMPVDPSRFDRMEEEGWQE